MDLFYCIKPLIHQCNQNNTSYLAALELKLITFISLYQITNIIKHKINNFHTYNLIKFCTWSTFDSELNDLTIFFLHRFLHCNTPLRPPGGTKNMHNEKKNSANSKCNVTYIYIFFYFSFIFRAGMKHFSAYFSEEWQHI